MLLWCKRKLGFDELTYPANKMLNTAPGDASTLRKSKFTPSTTKVGLMEETSKADRATSIDLRMQLQYVSIIFERFLLPLFHHVPSIGGVKECSG